MKRIPKLRRSKLNIFALLAAVLLCAASASANLVMAQSRLGRPPAGRQMEGTPILPAGTQAILDGTVLIIEMETKLDSGDARVSDRFTAVVATPAVDANGRTLVPAGARIEGHVTNVQKAKWRHRSGELGLTFDHFLLGDGRTVPLRATLVSANNRIDEEGNLRAKSSVRRDIIITTGGAGAGAGIGAVVGGSMLAGGGIGAAAGLTVSLLMKGKDVVIEPGDRFNLQLVQPVSVASLSGGRSQGRARTPVQLQPRARTGTATPGLSPGLVPGGQPLYDPNRVQTSSGQIPIYDIRAERGADGYVRVLVTGETLTNGWRIYTHHQLVQGSTLEIRLRGVPPSSSGTRQISHPSAPTIIVQDRNGAINRILAHGSNGDRVLTLGFGSGTAQLQPSQPGTQPFTPAPQPNRPRPNSGPSDGSSIDFGNPTVPSTGTSTGNAPRPSSLSSLATQVANQIDVLRMNYAAVIGLFVNTDGSVDALGGRRVSANERQLFDTLSYMLNSARTLRSPSISAYERQRAGQQLQTDTQTAQQFWSRIRSTGLISTDLERQWQNLQGGLRALIDAAQR